MNDNLIYLPEGQTLEEATSIVIAEPEIAKGNPARKDIEKAVVSFQGDILAATVFLKKYALRDRDNKFLEFTLDEAKDRWARAIAATPGETKPFKYFRDLYDDYLPAGRQMFGLGHWLENITLSNCYSTALEDDSLESIFNAAFKIAKTFAYGGGQGLQITNLRPAGAKVSNSAGQSTGAVSFVEMYSGITNVIGQRGRRGALLIGMKVDHPDIFEFIELKSKDIDKVRTANLSVFITGEFMQAVQDDGDFALHFDTKHESIRKTIRARGLWDRLITAAHASAEPGLMFWDQCKLMSPSDSYPEHAISCTNPCQPAHATVLTPTGISTIGELEMGSVIWSGTSWTKVTNKWSTGTKAVNEYHTNAGTFIGTTNHRIVCKGNKIEVSLAKSIDRSLGPLNDGNWIEGTTQDIIDGLVIGDGSVHKASNNLVYLCVGAKDYDYLENRELYAYFVKPRPALSNNNGKYSGAWEIQTTVTAGELPYTYERYIPERFLQGNHGKVRAFLRGLYSANGSICRDRVTLKASSHRLVSEVQQMLSSIGIASYITTNKEHDVKFKNGEYTCKTSYDLNITVGRHEFAKQIGFIQHYKTDKLIQACLTDGEPKKTAYEITEVISLGEMPVFDISVDDPAHTYWTGGLLVSNCAELPLDAGNACVLGSLLLHKFVRDPFTDHSWFDAEAFENTVFGAVRHLDNVVTLNIGRHPLPEQQEAARNTRRIGLSVTGLADMLAALGLQYGSPEALHVVEDMMQLKADTEYQASIKLAEERGSFPAFDPDKHYSRGFCATSALSDGVRRLGKERGQRNITLSTVSPSGSVSVIAQCSSGIEPVFARRYTRYVHLGSDRKAFDVVHPGLVRSGSGKEELFPEAHSIPYLARLEMQQVLQKYTDSAVSSTINLPREATKEDVANIYMTAWEMGLKGVTVYRDGCREGVLVQQDNDSSTAAGKLDTDTVCYKFTAEGGDKFYIHISYENQDPNKPYQVFATNYKATERDRFVKLANGLRRLIETKGIPEEVLKGQTVDNRLDQQADRSRNTLEKIARYLSLSLKCGYLNDVLDVLDQHAFAGTLASHIFDILGGNRRRKEVCEGCGSEDIVREEGCLHCRSCGWSRCSG